MNPTNPSGKFQLKGNNAAADVIFGLYPAKAAAELDPIEALRHE